MEPTNGFDAVKRRLPPQLQQLGDLPRAKKLVLAGACLALLAIIVAILFWNRDPEYRVLFSNLDERDGGEVVATLGSMNVPYELGSNGTAILVPSDRVHELRLNLATQGIPRGGSVGFELMDGQRMGLSNFLEQVNYHRALEGELSRTIQSLAVVRDAKVHLGIPKPSVFIRENQKPRASVLLTMHPGRVLDETQILGITHLVSSSVPNMPSTAVRIVDQTGALLNPVKDASAHLGLDGKQLSYVRALEEDLTKRIENMVVLMTGPGNMKAEVTVDVDFSQFEQTAETFKPNSDPNDKAIRSEHYSQSSKLKPPVGGVPGAFSNQPPQPPQAPIATDEAPPEATGQPGGSPIPADQVLGGGDGVVANQPVENEQITTRNFELDKTITHVRQTPGNNIRRLTAAVIVNNKKIVDAEGNVTYTPYTTEELDKLTNIVREAVGFNEVRGDTVSVANIAFDPDALVQPTSFWDNPENIDLLQVVIGEVIKYLIALLLALYLIFGVIRPLMRPPEPPEEEPLSLAGLGQSPFSWRAREDSLLATSTPEGEDIAVTNDDEAADEDMVGDANAEDFDFADDEDIESLSGIEKFLVQKPAYQSDLDFAKELALAEPKIVAKVIRDWMNPQ